MPGPMHGQGNQPSQTQQSGMMTGKKIENSKFSQNFYNNFLVLISAGNMMANANAANLPSTSANSMMNQSVSGMGQQSAATMGMGSNQNLAQRQQNQNPNQMMMNQGMNAGNINALQQMKQNQQQIGGQNIFAGAGGKPIQQRQVQL